MHRYLIFAAAGLSLLMYAIDSTAVAVAFPALLADFGTNVLWAAWTISVYMVAVTSAMPLMGNLGDSWGRKRLFLASLVLFTASSLACGLAPNIYSLVAFRFLQGVGGASFLPTSAAIVTGLFPRDRERAIGLFTSIFPIGGIIGPNLAGWIVSRYSWRYIFYINLPIGLGLFLLLLLLLKDPPVRSRSPVDFVGASFFFGAILFLMLGLNLLAEHLSRPALLLTALFAAVSGAFVYLLARHEQRASRPILDLALLRSTPFLAANLYNLIIGAGILGIFAFLPLYATSVHNLSTLASGMILTPRSVAIIVVSAVTSFLLKDWGYRWPMVLGVGIMGVSTILLGGEGLQLSRLLGLRWGVAAILTLLIMGSGIGMGMALPASNNACIELMPDKVATITGLRGMFRYVGGAFGISVITIILHLSATTARGFRATFFAFGLGLLLTIPLVFLMPAGRQQWGPDGRRGGGAPSAELGRGSPSGP